MVELHSTSSLGEERGVKCASNRCHGNKGRRWTLCIWLRSFPSGPAGFSSFKKGWKSLHFHPGGESGVKFADNRCHADKGHCWTFCYFHFLLVLPFSFLLALASFTLPCHSLVFLALSFLSFLSFYLILVPSFSFSFLHYSMFCVFVSVEKWWMTLCMPPDGVSSVKVGIIVVIMGWRSLVGPLSLVLVKFFPCFDYLIYILQACVRQGRGVHGWLVMVERCGWK